MKNYQIIPRTPPSRSLQTLSTRSEETGSQDDENYTELYNENSGTGPEKKVVVPLD